MPKLTNKNPQSNPSPSWITSTPSKIGNILNYWNNTDEYYSWTLWFFKNEKGKQWKDNCRPVTTFDTVEDFWAIYNHIQVRTKVSSKIYLPIYFIKLSSKLPTGCDYMLFKEGIVPEWEDSRNRDGGRWLLTTVSILIKKTKIEPHD